MERVRFQPPGCSIWVVCSESAPEQGRFHYELDERGEPCNPELHLGLAVSRARAFALAVEHEARWKEILHSFAERKRKDEEDRRRAEEAAGRWDEIRGEWEERKRRVRERQRAEGRPEAPAAAAPAGLEILGLSWPCSEDEIRRAFREKAKELHPDRGGSEAAFIELRLAYEEALELCARPGGSA
jgi:DnaJ-like protein